MHSTIELISYEPAYIHETAQAYLEVFGVAPWNETYSYAEVVSQLQTDQDRPGFGGVLFRSPSEVFGFSWWYDTTGPELNDRWRPRFTPKEQVPTWDGQGCYLMQFGIKALYRHKGLGQRLLKASLAQIEPTHDWIALSTYDFAHAGLALLKSYGFEDLGLRGVQNKAALALVRTIER